ncbi:Choline-sulfatase [Planctomycetales bacterium 10988]|nr:Choline-sulfatase [Planctomycetales bacterium 10988]
MKCRLGCYVAMLAGLVWAMPATPIFAQEAKETKSQKPNILVILADDLGYSDLGCFGGEIKTPNLDRLAANGLRMTRFYNTGRCCPSRGCLLSGKYPHQVELGHMVVDLGQPGYRGKFKEGAKTIAQVLKPAGYRSFIAGKWHLGTEDPTQHGFEEFYGTTVSAKRFWDPDHFVRFPEDHKRREYPEGEFYGTVAVTDHALDFLDLARETPEKPWFLYLAYNAPHFPLQAPKEYIAKYKDIYHQGWDALRDSRILKMKELGIIPQDTKLTPRSQFWDWEVAEPSRNPAWETLSEDRRADLARRMAIFAAMVDCMDESIGRVLKSLKKADELENTLIVFLSDNGACAEWDPFGFDNVSGPDNILHRGEALENMGMPGTHHSVGSGWANASNTPWRLYKHFNHEGGINSPFIVHWPQGLDRAGEIDNQPAHLIDLMPTFCKVAGLDPTSMKNYPGQSLLPIFEGEKQEPRTLYFEHQGNRAIHEGRWKLVAVRKRPWELYDVERDRTELNNLAAQHPDVVERMAAKWEEWAVASNVLPFPEDYHVGYLPPKDEDNPPTDREND